MIKKIKRYKYQILIFFFGLFILTHFYIDPDLGWHVAVGNNYLHTGKVLFRDEFSWTMKGYYWGNYSFLFDILVAFLISNFGYLFTCLFFGFVDSTAVLFLVGKKLNFVSFLFTLLGICLLTFSLGVRPSSISLIFFTALIILWRKNFNQKYLHIIFWFLFFALWANFHQGFLVGLVTIAGFIFVDWLSGKRKQIGYKIACFIFAFVGIFATPFTYHLWKGIVFDLGGVSTWRTVGEWQPVLIFFPENVFWTLSGIIFIALLLRKFKSADPSLFLLGAFLFAFSFIATHNVLFWSAIFIYLGSQFSDFKVPLFTYSKIFLSFIFLAVLLSLSLNFSASGFESINLTHRLTKDGYPTKAVDFMERNNLTSNVFNDYGWGGFLDWQHSNIAVFIDGRMTGWKKENRYFLADYVDLILNGTCSVRENYQIKVVLLKRETSTFCFRDFKKVYEDGVAKVLVPK